MAELAGEIELRKDLELHQGVQKERARIARESHDGLLQTLLGVCIRTGSTTSTRTSCGMVCCRPCTA